MYDDEIEELKDRIDENVREMESQDVQLATLRAELAAAKEQLEADRTACAGFVTALDKILDGRFWLTEGRGSYSWDDQRYRDEFKDAAEALLGVVKPMRKMAANLSCRLETTAEVIQARLDLKAELAAARSLEKTARDGMRILGEELAAARERLAATEARLNEVLTLSMAEHYELLEERARLAEAVKALEVIRGEIIEADENGLIEDSTCCYCDCSSVDGCDEACPREIARAAIDAAMGEASL